MIKLSIPKSFKRLTNISASFSDSIRAKGIVFSFSSPPWTSSFSTPNNFAISGNRPQQNLFLLNGVEYTGAAENNMQPGGTSEQVTVTATGEVQLQKDDSAVGNVIDQDRITRLPNADRQATSLLTLQPGVTPGGEVTGARADQNTFNLDGVDVSDNVIGLPFRVVIPARYASTRLPGKALLPIGGKPMLQWVYERHEIDESTLERIRPSLFQRSIIVAFLRNFGFATPTSVGLSFPEEVLPKT